MACSIALIIGIRFIYTLLFYTMPENESRLTKAINIDPSSIFEKIWSITYNFGIQQWGYCAIFILLILITLSTIEALTTINPFYMHKKYCKIKANQNTSNLLLSFWLLIMPPLASAGPFAIAVPACMR